MSSSTSLKMEIDNPAILKRSSSAPMINEVNNTVTSQPNTNPSRDSSTMSLASARPRRFSTSFSPVLGGPSSPKLTARVNQLRREESLDLLGQEAAHERELNSAMVMSQSWEDLTLVADKNEAEAPKNRSGIFDSLYLNMPVGSPQCSSPSPTRFNKQCFSPYSTVFKTTLSPSPTRKFATRRSQSPIAIRPSPLGPVKRKFELDEPEPSAKRGGLLIANSKLDVTMQEKSGQSGCEQLPHTQDQPMTDASKAN